MSIYVLFTLSVLSLSVLTIFLHRISPRIGSTALMFYLASLVAILGLSTPLTIVLEPIDDIFLRIPTDVLVPMVLMIVLMLYVANGTRSAQQAIYGVAAVNLISLFTLMVINVYAGLPTATADIASIMDYVPDYRQFLASSLVFIFDMLIIAIVYQGIKNAFPTVSKWLLPGIALLVALWVDAVLFYLLGSFGTEAFLTFLPGNIVHKTVAGLIISAPLTFYIMRSASKFPEFADHAARPIFDVMYDSIHNLSRALNQSQSELYENQINFQQLTTNIDDVFWLADVTNRHIYYVSPPFETLTGIKRANFYKNPELLFDIVHPDDRENVRRRFSKRDTYEEEFRIIDKTGETRWIKNKAFIIGDDNDAVKRIGGIAQDITEQKNAHEQTINLAIERERIRILRNFISDASHDLKTPIATIKLKAALVRTTKDDSTREIHIYDLDRQVDRLSSMIDNLFTLSRLENTDEWEFEPTDINTIITDLMNGLQADAQEKSIALSLDLERQKMPKLSVDTMEFSRAIGNLVSNAIRYTFKGGDVKVQTRYQFGDVIIRIIDTGIGISEDELPHIFERFYRAKTATHYKIEGSGLGLSIVKRVIDRHRGEISVESTPGKGTTFTIVFKTLQ